MKRIVSLILALLMALTSMLSLVGCSESESASLRIGQWLGMINHAFGMEDYVQKEPYISNVREGSTYYETVQTAAEWDIIDVSHPLDPNAPLLWKDALVTLVNAGNFTAMDASEDEKIQYAIDHFDPEIRKYWMDREIDIAKANSLLITAQEQWANLTYDTPVSKIEYSKDTVKIEGTPNVDYKYVTEDVVAVPEEKVRDVEIGDVVVLPGKFEGDSMQAYRVEDKDIKNGYAHLTTSDDFELSEVADEIYIEDSFPLDLSHAVIYDGNGNMVGGAALSDQAFHGDASLSDLPLDQAGAVHSLAGGNKFSFTRGSYKFEGSISSNSLGFKVEKESEKNDKIKTYVEGEISDFKVTNKTDMSWGKLKSAIVKVDYKQTIKIGAEKNFTEKENIFSPEKWKFGDESFLKDLSNCWTDVTDVDTKDKPVSFKLFSVDVSGGSKKLAAVSIDVFLNMKLDGSGEISFATSECKGIEYRKGKCRFINTNDRDVDVQLKAEAEAVLSVGPTINVLNKAIIGARGEVGVGGELAMTFHLADTSNHLIQESSVDAISPESMMEYKISDLVTDAEEIRKLAESQGAIFEDVKSGSVKLHLDTCVDFSVFMIIRVNLAENTLVGKLLKDSGISFSHSFVDDKNGKFLHFHVDNFDFKNTFKHSIGADSNEDLCTLEYVPFETRDITETETNTLDDSGEYNTEENDGIQVDEEGIAVGEVLIISDIKVVLAPEETKTIRITQLPKEYELSQVTFRSDNEDVAEIDKNGVIKACKTGTATIIVETKDQKFVCACSVTVTEDQVNDFIPLRDLQLGYNSKNILVA